MPIRVILGAEDLSPIIEALMSEFSTVGNRAEFVHDLMECMYVEQELELELQYFCLHLAERNGIMRDHCNVREVMLDVQRAGYYLARMLKEYRLFRNGKLPYKLGAYDHRGLLLIRNDQFFDILSAELGQACL